MRTMLTGVFVPAFLFLGSGPPPAEKLGSLAVVIRFTGSVPPPEKVMTTDGSTILHNDLVVDPKTKGLRYVMGILENTPVQPKVKGAKPVLVDQRDMIFVPRVVAVQHGQAIRFDNSDAANHSVMAVSTIPVNAFNVFVPSGKPFDHVFEPQKHPVTIGCSLHGWMRAWFYVVPHPWFAVSDERGQFQIKHIPRGKHTLWLRHPDTGHQERREIEIQPGKTLELTIEWKKVDKK